MILLLTAPFDLAFEAAYEEEEGSETEVEWKYNERQLQPSPQFPSQSLGLFLPNNQGRNN